MQCIFARLAVVSLMTVAAVFSQLGSSQATPRDTVATLPTEVALPTPTQIASNVRQAYEARKSLLVKGTHSVYYAEGQCPDTAQETDVALVSPYAIIDVFGINVAFETLKTNAYMSIDEVDGMEENSFTVEMRRQSSHQPGPDIVFEFESRAGKPPMMRERVWYPNSETDIGGVWREEVYESPKVPAEEQSPGCPNQERKGLYPTPRCWDSLWPAKVGPCCVGAEYTYIWIGQGSPRVESWTSILSDAKTVALEMRDGELTYHLVRPVTDGLVYSRKDKKKERPIGREIIVQHFWVSASSWLLVGRETEQTHALFGRCVEYQLELSSYEYSQTERRTLSSGGE